MLEIDIKIYLKITHIFSRTMWHLPREIFDLATESFNKVRKLKKKKKERKKERKRVIAEKNTFKWKINIKDTFKTTFSTMGREAAFP